MPKPGGGGTGQAKHQRAEKTSTLKCSGVNAAENPEEEVESAADDDDEEEE